MTRGSPSVDPNVNLASSRLSSLTGMLSIVQAAVPHGVLRKTPGIDISFAIPASLYVRHGRMSNSLPIFALPVSQVLLRYDS